MLNLIHFL